MKNKVDELQAKIEKLKRLVELAESYQNEMKGQRTLLLYRTTQEGDYREYKKAAFRNFGKLPEDWIDYYEDLITKYNEKINEYETKIKSLKTQQINWLPILIVIFTALIPLLFFKPLNLGNAITGFVTVGNNPPSFNPTPPDVFNLTQDVLFTYDVNATDAENNTPLNFSDNSKSSSVNWTIFSMDSATGIINFTPANEDIGSRYVTIIVEDSLHASVSKTVNFTVVNVNDAPNITGYNPTDTNPSVNENSSAAFNFNYSASDPDIQYGDSLTSSWYFDNVLNTTNQNFTYSAGFCDAGNHNVTLVVSDTGNLTARQYWNLTVNNTNRAPLFNSSILNVTWNEDVTLTNNITLTNFFYDLDRNECTGSNKDNLTFTAVGNTNITVRINSTTFNVTFIPQANWSGVETIYFVANDSYNTTISNNITLNVTNVNDAPLLNPIGNQTATAGVLFSLQVNASDVDTPYGDVINYSDNTTLFNISQTGLISFTPISAQYGNYSINITVNDTAGASASRAFNLEIKANSIPVLNAIGTLNATEDIQFLKNITASDADNDNVTFSTNATIFSIVQINGTMGLINFTPTNSQVSNYSINITATDSLGASARETILFVIFNANDAPTITAISTQYAKVNQTFTLTVTASDIDLNTPYSDLLNFTTNTTFVNITKLNSTNGRINFTPDDSKAGNWSIKVNVTDSSNASDSTTFLLAIAQNFAPVLDSIGNLNATEDHLFAKNITASDANNDNLNFTTNTTLFNLTRINATAVLINFTPNVSQVGNYTIRINVTDPDNATASETVNLSIWAWDDPPVLSYIGEINATQDVRLTYYLHATDEENDNLTFSANTTLFNITWYNITDSLINFTPNNDQVGNYSINISVNDSSGADSEIITFRVFNVNDAPSIANYSPATNISVAENSTLAFNVTANEPDLKFGDQLNFSWYLDNEIIFTNKSHNNQSNYTYAPGFCDAGVHNITLVVRDDLGLNVSLYWNVTVNNTNRLPVFGRKYYTTDADFSSGTHYNTSNTSGSLTLALVNSTSYNASGFYISPTIDFGDSNIMVNLTYINWTSVMPQGTNASFQTRSSDGSSWSGWSNAYYESGSRINTTARRYLQYKALLNTTNTSTTPQINEVSVYYIIGNTSTNKSIDTQWIDLDNYYADSDNAECNGTNKDNLSYTPYGNSTIRISIDSNSRVRILALATAIEKIYFVANDSYNITTSNNVTITITETSADFTSQTIQYIARESGGGGASTVQTIETKTKTITKTSPVYLKIIVPQAITMYENDTIIAPIRLENNENITLKRVKLSADINTTANISLSFSKDYFDAIAKGASIPVNLTIVSYKALGTYEVVLKATAEDPKYGDSTKLFINSIEFGKANKTQLNTKITFTRDLLSSNPECLELNELLTEAEFAINGREYAKATRLLDQMIEDCRYLISAKEKLEEIPKKRGIVIDFGKLKNWFIYGGILLFIAASAAFLILRRPAKRKTKT